MRLKKKCSTSWLEIEILKVGRDKEQEGRQKETREGGGKKREGEGREEDEGGKEKKDVWNRL